MNMLFPTTMLFVKSDDSSPDVFSSPKISDYFGGRLDIQLKI